MAKSKQYQISLVEGYIKWSNLTSHLLTTVLSYRVNDPILETRYLGLQNDFKTNEIKLVYKQY